MTAKKNPEDLKTRGAPTKLTDEMADKIADAIAAGLTNAEAAKLVGCSDRSIYRWKRKNPEFCQLYAHAHEDWAESAFDHVIKLASTPRIVERKVITDEGTTVYLGDDVQARKLEVDTYKWGMSKRFPDKYGDKVKTEHSGFIASEAPKTGAAAMVALNAKRKAALESLDSERPADE